MKSCTGRLYPYEYCQEFFLFPFYLLSFLVCTQGSVDVLPLLPSPNSFHLFSTSYSTRPFSQDPSVCDRSLSTDLSSSFRCLSQVPSTDSHRPQLLHRQDVGGSSSTPALCQITAGWISLGLHSPWMTHISPQHLQQGCYTDNILLSALILSTLICNPDDIF